MSSEGLRFKLNALVDNEVRERTLTSHARSRALHLPLISDRLRFSLPAADIGEVAGTEMVLGGSAEGQIDLPAPNDGSIGHKGSARHFSGRSSSILEVAGLISDAFLTDNGVTYASAGGLYPVEVFLGLLPSRIENPAESNMFHVLPRSRRLEPFGSIEEHSILDLINCSGMIDADAGGHFSGIPAMFIAYFVHLDRAICKYRYRGMRFAHLEAGAMCHQFGLVAQECGWGALTWGTFDDGKLCREMGLRPTEFLPAIMQLAGPVGTDGVEGKRVY